MTAEAIQEKSIDETRVNELLGRFVTEFGATMHAPLMIIGSELGLFRALAAAPLTTSELATTTGTAERYVREWARSQAATGWVTYDAATDRYSLTPEQALLLDENGPADIVGGYTVALAAGKSTAQLIEAFKSGDGVGWHEHDHGLFSGTARFFGAGYRTNLVANWIPALEGVQEKLARGARVADIGCGHGVSTMLMTEAFPASSFVGFDYHEPSLDAARETAREKGIDDRLRFLKATAGEFPGSDYDLVTMFDCLHDLGDPLGALVRIREALADDGTLMIVEPRAGDSVEENLNPVSRAFYAASTMFCTPNSLSQDVGLALGAQAGNAAVRELATKAGFTRFRCATETAFNVILELRP
jgi:SAM-dependent methyltransferase